MSRSLYKDQEVAKTAAFAGRLSETPENWPQELTSDLYKELPFLSDYDVNVNLDRVDDQRGYAFGYADVANKTERPEAEHEQAGLPHLRIPLVVRERARKPFSVIMDGERVMPLTEERVREQLFNPATFDLSVNQPSNPSLTDSMMPPQRDSFGHGEIKTAEARLFDSLLTKEAFKHISKEQWDAMYNSLEVQKLLHDYSGDKAHPAVQNKIYEMAVKHYGYHPKPEPPPPQKLQEYHQKRTEKAQSQAQKQQDKGQKMLQQGQKLMGAGQPKPSGAKPGGGTATKTASLLMAIAPTMRDTDIASLIQKIASDPTIKAGLNRSGISDTLIEAIDKTKRASAEERVEALADSIEPTVITLMKLPGNGGFLVKSASNEAFQPNQETAGEVVPPDAAAEAIGPDQAQAMQPGQTATAVADPVQNVEPPESHADVVAQFGEYLVQDMMGNQMSGWVFPQVMSWDGSFSPQQMMLFTNGAAYALQDQIAGELIGKSMQLPVAAQPRGEGCFYEVTRAGVRVTAPVTVRSGMSGPDGGPKYLCTDFMGNEFAVHLSAELVQPQQISESEFAVPATWKFMQLNNQTQLVPDPTQLQKAAMAKVASQSVVLWWNGSFNIEGGCGLEKIAAHLRYDMDPFHTEFMLGVLGVPGQLAKEKMAKARREGGVKLANLHSITTFQERLQQKTKEAASLAFRIPDLRRDLVKEAAALEDESTVDKVLALNFVNPENLSTFIDYLPELEQTSEKLAEMLLSSYLGEEAVPEGAVERAMRNMEEVVRSLKAVGHAEG